MTEPTPLTLAELEEQQALLAAQQVELDRQFASAALPVVQAAQAVMDRASTGKVADDMEALRNGLSSNSSAHQQMSNVIHVIRNLKSWLPNEAARLQALIAQAQSDPASAAG